ncbi:MAG TPA: LytTR family DNA-binding domain-containing protein [Sphingomonas sp.]|nr:LytTR family DNA-binding domain-containing protein [Sphingomonas sp.]
MVADRLRTLIVDDEPLAVERMQIVCAGLSGIEVVGTASDGAQALRLIEALNPELLLLDIAMPEMNGMETANALSGLPVRPMVVFVTAFDSFAVEAFNVDAVDYVLKPVSAERLARAVDRAIARCADPKPAGSSWAEEFWVPHRSELVRIGAADIDRIDAERDYMRLHVGQRSFLLHQTIAALEARLDPARFIRLHRSTIVRRDRIAGLRHDGFGVWCADLTNGESVRIGRTFLANAKAMAGR